MKVQLSNLFSESSSVFLQEVETEQYYTLFLGTLKDRGYDGYFCPKSRAKLVSEQERKHVDGCAVFFKTEKFTLVQKHTVEFNQVAMANSEGSEVMLNRVMTKDNIGVAVLLELNKDMFSSGMKPPQERQLVLVANAHMHWDPEYSDVKLIQTMMFLSELKSIAERASGSVTTGSPTSDPSSIPIVLCADLNSLPDSGVVEYLSNGGVAENHKDFKELRYNECLTNFSCNGKNGNSDGSITHSFQLKSAYDSNLMPYTNYTYDFKGGGSWAGVTRVWAVPALSACLCPRREGDYLLGPGAGCPEGVQAPGPGSIEYAWGVLGLELLPLLDQLPPRHTACRWLESLPAGVLVVLGVRGRVLWCGLAHSRWLLAGAWPPGLCRASAWGVVCPGVLGLWVHGWICSGVDGCRRGLWTRRCGSLGLLHCRCWVVPLGLSTALLWRPLDVCGSDLLSVRPGTMGQACGSSHSLLHIFVEKPCIQERVHTHTHRC
ncbi:hypothetical protein ATANTOWER_025578 [Ataeniobius toweri]|uniref:Uncharacterized protein n=1 Tax=Ataeniobius toweri TaxID=208326 RepID=A0ABU7B925_9TELE|nr:hypothetical protein [Ataeniobius toweri]